MSEKTNIWDGVLHTGKFIGSNVLSSDSDTAYTVTNLIKGHEYVVTLDVPSDRFRCSTFTNNPTVSNSDTGVRNLYDSDTPSAGISFTFKAQLNENYLMCYVGHISAGATNVQLTIYDLSANEPDKSRELEYISWKCFVSAGKICYSTSDPVVSYIVPVVDRSTYTVTMTEVGNRLRVVYSSVDPTTMTSDYVCVDVLDTSSFSVGYAFEYNATADGWLVIYVSNNGATPKISIVTDGVGGDGEPDEPEKEQQGCIQTDLSSVTLTKKTRTNPYELGTEYLCKESVEAVAIRVYAPSSQSIIANLWSESGEKIAETPCVTCEADGWTTLTFNEPITLEAGKKYTVSAGFSSYYYIDSSLLTFSTVFDFVQSRFTTVTGSYPSSAFDQNVYGIVDLVYQKAGNDEPDEPDEPDKSTKYLYNGVLLPELPVVEGYPYCWIRKNERTGHYDLLYSTGIWYESSNLKHDDDNNVEWYRIEIATADSAKEWAFNSSYSSNSWGNDSDRALIWSSHDIPKGSPTATDIYFYGSEPVIDCDKKYLIQLGDSLFTVTDGVLTAVEGSVSAELFRTYGVDEVPSSDLLVTLTDPVVLYWMDTIEHEIKPLVAVVHGVPPAQTLVSEDYDMTDETVLGIETVIVDASDDCLFAVSFDEGQTWKLHTGETWATLSEVDTGMSTSVMSAISSEDWNSEATTGKFRFRVTIPSSSESYLTSLVVDYLN